MPENNLVVPPPIPKLTNYPAAVAIVLAVVFTAALLYIAGKFDPTHGTLTISLLIVLTFMGTVVFVLFFTVPNDEITSGVIGGLIAAFGAIIAFWLGRPRDGNH